MIDSNLDKLGIICKNSCQILSNEKLLSINVNSIQRQIQPLNPQIGFSVNSMSIPFRQIQHLNREIGLNMNSIQRQFQPLNLQAGFNVNSFQRRIQPL